MGKWINQYKWKMLLGGLMILFVVSSYRIIRHFHGMFESHETTSQLTEILEAGTKDVKSKPNKKEGTVNPLLEGFSKIQALNQDCVAWLKVPGTKINYPVMHTPDEPEYYLRRSFNKNYVVSGTPFVGEGGHINADCFIIYGHNMQDQTMFSTLENYQEESFYRKSPNISMITAQEVRKYEIFAVVTSEISTTDESELEYYLYSGDLSKQKFDELVKWLKVNSLYDTKISPKFGEQILILSTCSYHDNNGRLIVVARRI